ncbi:hypothetical protein [Blastopirellula retiformator]|uniref:Uncharacterized protein n=1 Tax=Blastopirellula retiformator TaxID=2527970 RepID=A0A5C5UWH1_9BACT|nr:hypothetical protein [Blastopirellula retiformator]TWT30716.1 hypothetical protein Enr8_42390 [Blastopirellula retiformator]
MASSLETIWDAVYADILAMGLTGITSANIKQQQFPYNPIAKSLSSGIFVCPEDEVLPNFGSNERMEIRYGVSITMIQASNQALGKGALGTLLTWREAIRGRYHDRLPINVAGVHRFYCEQGMTVLPGAFLKQFDASALIIRAVTYEG